MSIGSAPEGPGPAVGRRLRLGVAFVGDAEDPDARSGTPLGVVNGLRSLPLDVVALRAALPDRLEKAVALRAAARDVVRASGLGDVRSAYSSALLGARVTRSRSAALARSVAQSGPLDAIVQLGAGFVVDHSAVVVYDDMTIAQAITGPYPHWRRLRPTDQRARLDLQGRVYRGARACCMTTSWAAQSVVDDFGVAAADVHVVGAGTHERPREVERDWGSPRFLFVGKDWSRKNGPRVLAAFARLRAEVPAARLDLVGGHPEVHQDGVVGHGMLSRSEPSGRRALECLYDEATCFVMPSLYEPGGVVFTEAGTVGLPSIGGTVGGSRDLIGPGGLVVDPTSEEAILSAMRRLADPDVARRTGEAAGRHAQAMQWGQVSGRLVRALGLRIDGVELPTYLG